MALVLASTSRFRRALLHARGIPHRAVPPVFEEVALPGEGPADGALRFARGKAASIPAAPGEVVLGADQTLSVDGRWLRKPTDPAARLRELAGRAHTLHSAVSLFADGREVAAALVETDLRLRSLEEEEIQDYLRAEDVTGSVAAYLYEGQGLLLVEAISHRPTRFADGASVAVGDDAAVLGLPLLAVARLLRGIGRAALIRPGGASGAQP